ALIILGLSALYAGNIARALDLCRECVERARPLGDRWLLGNTLVNLADSTGQAGDYDTAELLLHEAVGATLELGAQGNMVWFLESLAGVYIEQHRVERAIRVLAATDSYRTDQGLPLFAAEQRRIESFITRARSEAGPVRFGLAWSGGQSLTLNQVVNEVLLVRQERHGGVFITRDHVGAPYDQRTEEALTAAPW
ncbi:MAG TPA: tetratricopeptide repeat protein, partial [Arthrobacter sp.]